MSSGSSEVACSCSHVMDEHSATGKCQIDACLCGGWDPYEDEDAAGDSSEEAY